MASDARPKGGGTPGACPALPPGACRQGACKRARVLGLEGRAQSPVTDQGLNRVRPASITGAPSIHPGPGCRGLSTRSGQKGHRVMAAPTCLWAAAPDTLPSLPLLQPAGLIPGCLPRFGDSGEGLGWAPPPPGSLPALGLEPHHNADLSTALRRAVAHSRLHHPFPCGAPSVCLVPGPLD